jgi:HflK protein
MPIEVIVVLIFAVILVVVVMSLSIKVVHQSTVCIVERFGKYQRTLEVGIHFVVPFIDKVRTKISLKEKVGDFDPQPVITRDNVTMQIDTVVYYRITDPYSFTYNVEHPMDAIENITATTLRNIIGDLELDQTLTSRDTINLKMRAIIDEATDPWGIKITRVELKNILPPRDIQEAMEKQMRAEREKRQTILRAEGEKSAAILCAEGEKDAAILRAEAEKQASIARAQGQALALREIFEAQAAGIKMINDAYPSTAFLTLKGYEALEKIASSPSSKLIVPSDLQNVTGYIASIAEVLKADRPKETPNLGTKPKETSNTSNTPNIPTKSKETK